MVMFVGGDAKKTLHISYYQQISKSIQRQKQQNESKRMEAKKRQSQHALAHAVTGPKD